MKLHQIKRVPGTDDLGATVCVVEPGDGVMVGSLAAGVYGNADDCVLLTFTAGPSRRDNNVEIAVPRALWPALVDVLRAHEPGIYVLGGATKRRAARP